MSQPTGDQTPNNDTDAAVNTSSTNDDATLVDCDESLAVDTSACSAQTEPDAEPDEDRIVTLKDVLAEQNAQDMEYAAVLGGSDHKSCTYAKVSVIDIRMCARDAIYGDVEWSYMQ